LLNVSSGFGVADVVTVEGAELTGPVGPAPVAVAVFEIDPPSTSVCVSV
jgi:hypothetical protein